MIETTDEENAEQSVEETVTEEIAETEIAVARDHHIIASPAATMEK